MSAPAARIAALGCALGLLLASGAEASPYIHAHRGGPLVEGIPTYGENTMAAFENAAAEGYILEMDAKLTSDDVPMVMHDVALDRTTDCTGRVVDKTAAELADCEVDIVGTSGNFVGLSDGDPRREPIPTVQQALEFARDAGATVNLEIKNIPTEDDFDRADVTNSFANAVIDAVIASGFPPSRLIIQSFWPPNLTEVEERTGEPGLAGVDTSLLTSHTISGAPLQTNQGGPAFADANGYEWVSPQWPLTGPIISEAHGLGLQVVPYTLNTEAEIGAAFDAGVDAVITDDPAMARAEIGKQEGQEQGPPPLGPRPSPAQCEQAEASRTAAPIEAHDSQPGAPRVFAIQFKQELRHVKTYDSFRVKIECLIRDYVVPDLAQGRPNVVALNEDIGLMTIATGTRGEGARSIFEDPSRSPSCPGTGQPCGAVGALGAVTAAYSPQVAAYQTRFGAEMEPVSSAFVAATDTLARGWMQTFSDLAKRYGVYILGSNNQSPFRESRDPSEIDTFADPDLDEPPDSVFVATEPAVYNEVFMWAPDDVREEGPLPLRNAVAQNKKVPLTAIEEQIQLTNGPSMGPDAIENLRPYAVPGTGARIGFATSKPAFEYHGAASFESFGDPPPADPCADTYQYYMHCLNELGANLVMQDEANGGSPWPADSAEMNFQPLEWNRSTWRAVADPKVSFDYNVTPFMVGNLADLPFDGQTSITQRGLSTGPGCHYVGATFQPDPPANDPSWLEVYSGPKTEFIAMVPWVSPDGPRDELRATGQKLAPGSGDPLENDYLETAIVADLPFPPDPSRPSCVTTTDAGGGGGGGGGGGSPAGGSAGPQETQPGARSKRCRKRRAAKPRRRCITQRLRQTPTPGR